MAFDLYCNGIPSVSDYENAEEQLDECRQYTVEDLFCCAYCGEEYPYELVKAKLLYTK